MVRYVRNRRFQEWYEQVTHERRNCCTPDGCDEFVCAYGEFVMRHPRMARRMFHASRSRENRVRVIRFVSWEMHVIHKQYRAKRRHW